MGSQPSLPNFNFSIGSDCCNGKKDECDGNRKRRPSWIWKRKKSVESAKTLNQGKV